MSLINILTRIAAEEGEDITNAGRKAYLTSKVNQACEEIYENEDLPISLMEVDVRVTRNWEMSLPPFVGELRAIRSGCTDYCTPYWVLNSQWPRYNKTQWESQWNNWRIKGYSPVAIDYTNTAPGTIEYPTVDSSVVVTIFGETTSSNNQSDSITMAATSNVWTSSFTQIKKITKNKVTAYNVTVKDADGNEIAIIYANQLEANYIIVDVSKFPQMYWGCCTCPDGSYIMEVLYKPILNKLVNDTDEFQVPGYEEVIILRVKQLLAELQEGKEQRAMLMNAKSKDLLEAKILNKQGSVRRTFTTKRSPYYTNWNYIPYGSADNFGNF